MISSLVLTLAVASGVGEPDANLLRNPSFEQWDERGATDWRQTVGAVSGDGQEMSHLDLVGDAADGAVALRLAGDASTVVWQAYASREIEVEAGQRLWLGGRIRTQDVRLEGRQFGNCDLAVRFTDAKGRSIRIGRAPVIGTEVLTGTHDWTRVERLVTAPEGATAAQVLCFLSMSGVADFDDLELSVVEEPAWQVAESEHFVFHFLPEAPIDEEARRRNELNLDRSEKILGTELAEKVRFYRYVDREQKRRLTGDAGNAHVEGARTIHTVWPVDSHEMVHLITRRWGEADSALFGEGIAVYLAGWHGRPLDEWVTDFRAAGTLPRLADIADTGAFRALDDRVTYPVAGSFVGWLVEKHGMGMFRRAYCGEGTLEQRLVAVYGEGLARLEQAWLKAVEEAR